jgi:hypothetical protein
MALDRCCCPSHRYHNVWSTSLLKGDKSFLSSLAALQVCAVVCTFDATSDDHSTAHGRAVYP